MTVCAGLFYVKLQLWAQRRQEQSIISQRFNRSVGQISLLYYYSHMRGNLVKTQPSLWVHIDAAWAGVALSCPENRERSYLKEINEFANSFCTNFHKVMHYYPSIKVILIKWQWGLVNFDASTLWVRNRKHLTDALDVTPPFLRTTHGDAGPFVW